MGGRYGKSMATLLHERNARCPKRRPKSCSRPSTTQPCTSASKLFSACTPLAEPPALLSTLVMVSPTTSQSMKVTPFPTPLPVWTWPVEILLTTSRRSLLKEDTPSSPPLNVKSSEMSRKSFATSPWTSNPRWPPPPPPPPSKRATNCQMDKSSPSETKDSVAQKPSSNHPSSVWKLLVSTRPPTTPSWSATLTSVRIFTETTSFPEVPPCTQVLPTECKRKSPLLLHPPWRSRSLLHQRENTPSGSEVPSLLPSPPSNPCGSPRPTTMKLVHPLSTENASKFLDCTRSFFFTSCIGFSFSTFQ